MSEINKQIPKKRNKKPISVKLHPKTIRLLELLSEKTSETKTDYLESGLWIAFSMGKLTKRKTRDSIMKIVEQEFPKTSE